VQTTHSQREGSFVAGAGWKMHLQLVATHTVQPKKQQDHSYALPMPQLQALSETAIFHSARVNDISRTLVSLIQVKSLLTGFSEACRRIPGQFCFGVE
jgi:hypothetical protein